MIALSFFEKRENKGFFGLLNSEEKVYFERWRIPVLVNENPLPRGLDTSSEIARTRIYDTARDQVKERMLSIFEVCSFLMHKMPFLMGGVTVRKFLHRSCAAFDV